MTPRPDPQPRPQQQPAEPTHREVLALLRKHFGPDVQVLRVSTHTVAEARRRQQSACSWRLIP